MTKALILAAILCAMLCATNHTTRADAPAGLQINAVTIKGPRGNPVEVIVALPKSLSAEVSTTELPTLVALHGQAAIDSSARTVFDRYQLHAAYNALKKNRVSDAEYLGWSDGAHNRFLHAQFEATPLPDMAIVAPPVPNFFVERPEISVAKYVEWIAASMLPQLRERFPMLAHRRNLTGIAGVSMGATLALRAGFRYPELFGSVSAIEPALRGESLQIADDAKHTSRSQYIQLVMPQRDEYLIEAQRFSRGLRQGQVPHLFVVLPGDHGERFAAGAGSMEMLRFAGSVLRNARPAI